VSTHVLLVSWFAATMYSLLVPAQSKRLSWLKHAVGCWYFRLSFRGCFFGLLLLIYFSSHWA